MTAAALRVPHSPQRPSPASWFQANLGVPAGWPANNASAAYYNGTTYIGFCDGDGNIRVAAYKHSTGAFTLSPIIVSGLAADGHCGPSVLVRSSDKKIVIAAAPHAGAHMYVAVSTNAEDVTAWAAAVDIVSTLGASTCTYANLFQLSGESGKIYLFYRVGTSTTGVLYYSTSTDGGITWAAETQLYGNTGHGCYWAISSDDTSRIDFLVTDGNAPNGDTAGVYHFYYTGGGFHKSDGTNLGSAPYTPSNLTELYDGAIYGTTRAPFAIATNGGNPVGVWAAYNSSGTGSNENYWYASSSSGTWTVNKVDNTGSTPDVNFSEGGICLDTTNLVRVYLSKLVSGVWQMFEYETSDGGASWTGTQLTSDAASTGTDIFNLRPVAPRDASSVLPVVWLFGPHWLASSLTGAEPPAAQIRGYPNPVKVF